MLPVHNDVHNERGRVRDVTPSVALTAVFDMVGYKLL